MTTYERLHFTPDGVSRPRALVTINIGHLTEGRDYYEVVETDSIILSLGNAITS